MAYTELRLGFVVRTDPAASVPPLSTSTPGHLADKPIIPLPVPPATLIDTVTPFLMSSDGVEHDVPSVSNGVLGPPFGGESASVCTLGVADKVRTKGTLLLGAGRRACSCAVNNMNWASPAFIQLFST